MDKKPTWVHKMNAYFKTGTPFFAVIPFDRMQGDVWGIEDSLAANIYFEINSPPFNRNASCNLNELKVKAPTFEIYERQFNHVMHEIAHGNTYLLNLCTSTEISADLNLAELYEIAQARYKLYYQDKFVVFSPETFVRIEGDELRTFPMKGTIDARLPDAQTRLREDEKELAEHYTIVDLLRNDIGMVCDQVDVKRFAYIEQLETSNGPILQMSSEIVGKISKQFLDKPGDLFYALLPAGSITGAPKQKTVELINRIENFERGFYTGIMIHFDGQSFDSGVLIRFIEETHDGKFVFKSGGGITYQSQLKKEYEEILKKIYIPVL